MCNIVEVYFKLTGGMNFNPNIVSDVTGVNPSDSYMMGSINREAPLPRYSSWILSSGRVDGDNLDIYDLSKGVISQLMLIKDEIIGLIKSQNLESCLQVAIWISIDEDVPTPAIGFDSDVTKFLGDIGASIDIDMYRNWGE